MPPMRQPRNPTFEQTLTAIVQAVPFRAVPLSKLRRVTFSVEAAILDLYRRAILYESVPSEFCRSIKNVDKIRSVRSPPSNSNSGY